MVRAVIRLAQWLGEEIKNFFAAIFEDLNWIIPDFLKSGIESLMGRMFSPDEPESYKGTFSRVSEIRNPISDDSDIVDTAQTRAVSQLLRKFSPLDTLTNIRMLVQENLYNATDALRVLVSDESEKAKKTMLADIGLGMVMPQHNYQNPLDRFVFGGGSEYSENRQEKHRHISLFDKFGELLAPLSPALAVAGLPTFDTNPLIRGQYPDSLVSKYQAAGEAGGRGDITIGDIAVNVDAPGADSTEIARNVSQTLLDQLHLAVDTADSNIAR